MWPVRNPTLLRQVLRLLLRTRPLIFPSSVHLQEAVSLCLEIVKGEETRPGQGKYS